MSTQVNMVCTCLHRYAERFGGESSTSSIVFVVSSNLHNMEALVFVPQFPLTCRSPVNIRRLISTVTFWTLVFCVCGQTACAATIGVLAPLDGTLFGFVQPVRFCVLYRSKLCMILSRIEMAEEVLQPVRLSQNWRQLSFDEVQISIRSFSMM